MSGTLERAKYFAYSLNISIAPEFVFETILSYKILKIIGIVISFHVLKLYMYFRSLVPILIY